jgi:hypothetical protein
MVFIWIWYALSLPLVVWWGVCFPGLGIYLYFFDSHPLSTKLPQFEPFDITKGMFLAFCLVFTAGGLVGLYFNVRELRKLRLDIST